MASVNITQLLGTDSIGAARITINKNFKLLQDAVNNIELFLNTTPSGGDLNVGNILIKKQSNPVNAILFHNEASGLVDGNFNIQGDLNVNSNFNLVGNAVLNGNILFNGGSNIEFIMGGASISNILKVKKKNELLLDEQFISTSPYTPTLSAPGPLNVNVGTSSNYYRYLFLNYALYLSTSPSNTNKLIINPGAIGQVIYIGINNVSLDLLSNGLYIDKTNFSSEYTNDITIIQISSPQPSDVDKAKKLWLEIIYTPSGWKVKSAHKDIIY